MGLPRSLTMLLLFTWLFWSLPSLNRAQSPRDARALDALLQDYAYRAFIRPRTGIIYDANVTSNLTGITISAMRLRSGSLRSRGVRQYKEFAIPVRVVTRPYVGRLVLVYQNLGNWSMVYYPLPGYMHLAPVLGLLAYDASNLSATNLAELNVNATGQPITVRFPNLNSVPDGLSPRCVWFNLSGIPHFSNVLSSNLCSTFEQGHFSIVVESIAPSPSPVFPTPPGGGSKQAPAPSSGGHKNRKRVWIIVGSVIGGLMLLALSGVLLVWLLKYKRRKKMLQMEKAAEAGEALPITRVCRTKAPVASVTRTQPTLETEYVP